MKFITYGALLSLKIISTEFYLLTKTNRLWIIGWCLANLLHVDKSRACGPSPLLPSSLMRIQILRRVTHTQTRTCRHRHIPPSPSFRVFIFPRLVYLESMKAPPRRSTLCSANQVDKKNFATSELPALSGKNQQYLRARALSTKNVFSVVRKNWWVSNCSAINKGNTCYAPAREYRSCKMIS